MGNLTLGTNTITNVKFGNNQVTKIYLGTNLIWTGGTAPSYSAELNAIIARANLEGFTLPSSTVLTACDALITAMNTGGDRYFEYLDRFYNFAYNDTSLTNFSRIDWKNPATSPLITLNGGMGYQVGGFIGNGTDAYLDTGFIPSVNGVNYTDFYATRASFVYTIPTVGAILDGNTSNTNRFFISAVSGGHSINNNVGGAGVVDTTGGGLKAITRYTSTVTIINRTIVTNPSNGNSVVLPTVNQHILRSNTGYSNAVVSMYFLGFYLDSSSQIASFRTSYNTYLSAVGLSPNTDA